MADVLLRDTLLREQIILGIKSKLDFEVFQLYFYSCTDKSKTFLVPDPDSGESILHLCITYQRPDLFNHIIDVLKKDHIKHIDSVLPCSGDGLLHRVVDLGEYTLLVKLLRNFVWDVNVPNNAGMTVKQLLDQESGE